MQGSQGSPNTDHISADVVLIGGTNASATCGDGHDKQKKDGKVHSQLSGRASCA
jgi:hypothetical protein